ncbi:endonuclease/exonuclease/phosphatase family protein [Tenacibaculum sp. UWU-22]|uniref:endonuclease/exonuclease/phosphatase family protein n=1 Tax=Tenacibaculum sp. UWU-22 TaxID=3234187 RepID=UPI0034DB544C
MTAQNNLFTIAFYNTENLFDTEDDPLTLDDDFTPKGRKHWNKKRYKNKIKKITAVIAQLGAKKTQMPPVIVGLVEIENSKVVRDLVQHKNLSKYDYSYIHHESSDERGIDVALLYNKTYFEVIENKTFPLLLKTDEGKRDYTRDILLVKGKLNGELMYIFVNHWPSRRDGEEKTRHKRIKAAKLVQSIIADIYQTDSNAKIIIMGDFNDEPTSESIKKTLVTDNFYNPMESLFDKGYGSLTYNGKWDLFDQIIFSKNFFQKNAGTHSFLYAEVFNKKWLKVYKGKLKGSPFRTYIGPWYQGGFSDHFPVYLFLEKN